MEIQAFGYLGLGSSNLEDWTTFATSAIVDCTGGGRTEFRVTLSGRAVPIQSDLTFSYDFSGTLTDSSGQLTNIQETEFVRGKFTPDGKADGTFALSKISFDYSGQHFDCTQGAVGWHVTKQ